MAQLRPKIVKLAKIIGGASGMLVKIDENAPEYYCMADIVTDEEADIAIAAGLRKERTAQWLADKVGGGDTALARQACVLRRLPPLQDRRHG